MNPMDRRSSETTFFCLITIGLFLTMMVFIAGCTSEPSPRLCVSRSEYDLTIRTNEPISNATFYLPLPVKNGSPIIGIMQLERSPIEKSNFSIDFVQFPPDLDLTGAYPVHNNHPWFLKISADRIDPDPLGSAGYSVEISNSTDLPSPVIFANTLYPIGNESVLLPKLDFLPPPREIIPSRSQEWIEYSPFRTPQNLLIYANYSASPTTRVEIQSGILAFNYWVEPATPGRIYYGVDGGGNDYLDSYSWTWYGESQGWQVVNGEFRASHAVYPNLDHPRWQKMLNGTAQAAT